MVDFFWSLGHFRLHDIDSHYVLTFFIISRLMVAVGVKHWTLETLG
jgi:hypothetical protein